MTSKMRSFFERLGDMMEKPVNGYPAYIFFLAKLFEPDMKVPELLPHMVDPVLKASMLRMLYLLLTLSQLYDAGQIVCYQCFWQCLVTDSTNFNRETSYSFDICPRQLNKILHLFSSRSLRNIRRAWSMSKRNQRQLREQPSKCLRKVSSSSLKATFCQL